MIGVACLAAMRAGLGNGEQQVLSLGGRGHHQGPALIIGRVPGARADHQPADRGRREDQYHD